MCLLHMTSLECLHGTVTLSPASEEWYPLRANFEAKFADMKDYIEQKGSLEDLWKDDRELYENREEDI